jgi:hypothetical protein
MRCQTGSKASAARFATSSTPPTNKTARTVAIFEGETLNAPALRTMFEQIIANNRAGGWRQLKREP